MTKKKHTIFKLYANNAGWHNKCKAYYSKTQIERLIKRKNKEETTCTVHAHLYIPKTLSTPLKSTSRKTCLSSDRNSERIRNGYMFYEVIPIPASFYLPPAFYWKSPDMHTILFFIEVMGLFVHILTSVSTFGSLRPTYHRQTRKVIYRTALSPPRKGLPLESNFNEGVAYANLPADYILWYGG